MEFGLPLEAARGSLDDSFALHGDRRRLVIVERGRWYRRLREGLSRYEAPLVVSVPGGGRTTRPEAAVGILLAFSPRLEAAIRRSLAPDALLDPLRPAFVRLPAAESAKYRELFDELADLANGLRRGGPDLVAVKATGLLRALRRFVRADEDTPGAAGRPDRGPRAADAEAILEYLKLRFREPLSLEAMAAELGYSPSYLSRSFKKMTGRCLFEDVNARRIAEACALLKESDLTVSEIAFAVGYNNLSFFNRYFRKLMDASPAEYRRRNLS